MVQGLNIKFDLSNYNSLQKELNALDYQVYSMREIDKRLGDLKSPFAADHLQEGARYEQDLQDTHTN